MKNDTITTLLIHQVTAKEAYKTKRAKCTTEQAISSATEPGWKTQLLERPLNLTPSSIKPPQSKSPPAKKYIDFIVRLL